MIPRRATPAQIACLLALGTGVPAGAATYLVPSGYPTIPAAVRIESCGVTFNRATGVHREALSVNDGCTSPLADQC